MKTLFVLLFLGFASGAKFSGLAEEPADSKEGVWFLGKFVFDSTPVELQSTGNYTVELSVTDPTKDYTGYEVWVFSDEDTSWTAVYKKDLTCAQARTHSKTWDEVTQDTKDAYKVNFDADGKWDRTEPITQHARPRYWYLVLAKCNEGAFERVEGIEYNVHMTNVLRGAWDTELGTNVAGLQTLYLCFFILYLPFLGVHFYGVHKLREKLQYVHPLVRLFAFTLICQFLAISLFMANYLAATEGVGIPSCMLAGDILQILSHSSFIIILLLMAKGWTISGEELTGKMVIVGAAFGFMIASILILVWQWVVTDVAAVYLDLAVVIFKIAILVAWLLLAVWFCLQSISSYSKEDNPVKKLLYRNLSSIYSLWFLGLPAVSILSMMISPVYQEKVSAFTSVLVSTFGYMVLSFMLWPSRAEEYFCISTPDVMKAQIDTYEQL